MFHVFHRTWWRDSKTTIGKLEPHAGRKTTIDYVNTHQEAVDLCREYNSTHDPGRYSRKAEFTEE